MSEQPATLPETAPTTPAGAPLASPPVSVVLAVRDEERFLDGAVRRILGSGYAGELEVVLAVAPSTDRTREIADALAAQDPRVQVVDNPTGWTPNGLNLAVATARHDILVRVDGHSELSPGYITQAVEVLLRTGAANVGGRMLPVGETPFEQAVARAMSTPLGIGAASFHTGGDEGPAPTVYLGVFRRDALAKVGGFDERFVRAQDWELNHRLRAAGETVWFDPRLGVDYRPRGSYRALARQFYKTGQWRRFVMREYPETASWRYLAPPAATAGVVGGLVLGALGATVGPRWLMVGLAAPVGYGAIVAAGAVAAGRGLPAGARRHLAPVVATMHLTWGAGFLRGVRPKG